MRGARLIPWRLREGDIFRLGQAYVLVAKVRNTADTALDVSALSPFDESAMAAADDDGDDSDDENARGSRGEGRPRAHRCS